MISKELKKLSRRELVDIIYQLKKNEQEKQEVSAEDIVAELENLKNAMDCFDLDGADEAMHKLEGFVFPEELQKKVENLSAFVADVAMEDVMRLAEELIQEISK